MPFCSLLLCLWRFGAVGLHRVWKAGVLQDPRLSLSQALACMACACESLARGGGGEVVGAQRHTTQMARTEAGDSKVGESMVGEILGSYTLQDSRGLLRAEQSPWPVLTAVFFSQNPKRSHFASPPPARLFSITSSADVIHENVLLPKVGGGAGPRGPL